MTSPAINLLRAGIAAQKRKAVKGAYELYGTTAASSNIYRRTNGDDSTWLTIAKPFTGAVTGIAYSKTLKRFVMTNGTSAQVARSDDKGVTWTVSAAPQAFKDIIWVEPLNLFFAVGGTSCYRSADGITWSTPTSMPSASAWDTIGFSTEQGTGSGRLAVAFNRYVCYSDNGGLTFTTQIDCGYTTITDMKYSNYHDKWFFTRSSTTPSLFSSVDLATFTLVDSIQAATALEITTMNPITAGAERVITCGTSQGRYNTDAGATVFATNAGNVAGADICAMPEINKIVTAPSGSAPLREMTASFGTWASNASTPTDTYSCICYHYGE